MNRPSSNQLSFRSSCDRCRSQKLKCTISPDSSPDAPRCVRCCRAKLECVFSRRRGPGQAQDASGPGTSCSYGGSGDSGSSRSSVRGDVSHRSSVSLDASAAMHVFGMETGVSTPGTFGSLTHGSLSEDNGMVYGGGFAMQGIENHTGLPAELSLDLAQSLAAHHFAGSEPDAFDFGGGIIESSSSDISSLQPERGTQPLTALAVEVDGMIDRLGRGSWGQAGSINNYPVGCVLSLVQDYQTILCGMQLPAPSPRNAALALQSQHSPQPFGACTDGRHCSHHAPAHSTTSSPGVYNSRSPVSVSSSRHSPKSTDSRFTPSASEGAATADMSSILLALSGYLRLAKLLSLVFSQFETYLHLLNVSPPATSHMGMGGRGLQLGQLPSTHETCSKIYTAVQLLLDALQMIEELAGLPSRARIHRHGSNPCPRDVVPREGSNLLFRLDVSKTLLGQNIGGEYARGNCPEVDELAAKTASIQALLREKMNL